jgi:opacity protein-like surface antigen
MRLVAMLAGLAFSISSRPAVAQESQGPAAVAPPSRVYLGVWLGQYKPSNPDDLAPFSFDSGFEFQGRVGYRVNPFLSVELGLGHYKSTTNTSRVTDATFGTVSAGFELTDTPLTLTLLAGFPVDRVTFYGLAGVGYHMTELKVNAEALGVAASLSDSQGVFGLHLGAGLSVSVTHWLNLGAELRRTFVSAEYESVLGPGGLGAPTTRLKLDGMDLGVFAAFNL